MPAPYSDNMYSGDDNAWDGEQDDALSPTDGYFHASSSGLEEATTSSPPYPVQQQQQRQSSSVPFVPNVMVEDPTLHEDRAAAKAKEAEEERLINSAAAGRSTPFHGSQPHHQPTSSVQGQPDFYQSSHSSSPPHSSQVAAYPQFQAHRHLVSASASASASSSSSPSSSGHHHRRSIDEEISPFQTPSAAGQATNQYTVHRQADAPPAYSPPAFSPTLSSGYQTFTPPQALTQALTQSETMGLPEENQSLLPRQPESMGGPPNGSQEPLWRRIKSSANSTTRKKIRTILGVLVILSIIAALFGTSFGVYSRRKPGIIDKSPVKAPPTNNPPPNMSWPPNRNCLASPRESLKINEFISFGNNKKLSIIQTIEKDSKNRRGHSPNVYGEVILQPVDESSIGKIQVEIFYNIAGLHFGIDFNKRDQRFELTTPRWIDWRETNVQPCIQMRITVSIPREAQLESFLVDAIHLNVAVKDGLVLAAVSDAQIKTISGDVVTGRLSGDVAPYTLASRSIIIDTVSGDVIGWFPLYDVLKIHTVSGEVKADLTPKPSSDKQPEKAVLSIESFSGDIKVVEPLLNVYGSQRDDKFPPRDYVVDVSTSSGQVVAELAFTSKAKIETISGNQKLKLLPIFGSGSSEPVLSTDTKSGQTALTVLEPLWKKSAANIGHFAPVVPPAPHGHGKDSEPKVNDDEPWIIIHPDEQLGRLPPPPYLDVKPSMVASRGDGDEKHGLVYLKSHHASISGDFRLKYPVSWEGKFTLTTISGSQEIRGDDLDYKRAGGIIKRIDGTKGSGKSDLTIESMSGREELAFGNA